MTNTVTSKDGTEIAYYTFGSGPAVVVVPGALTVANDFTAFAKALAHNFTVHVVERRGRGESGPQGNKYSIERDCEDVVAVLSAIKTTSLVGHSFGGLIALEVARLNPSITKLAVYEPGVSIGGSVPMNWTGIYEQKLRDNKPIEAFIAFVKAMNPASRNTPNLILKLILPRVMGKEGFQTKLDLLSTNLLEHYEVARLNNTYENYHEIKADTLLMYGGKGQSESLSTVERLTKTVPSSHIATFPKLDHFGIIEKGSEEVAMIVVKFLETNQ